LWLESKAELSHSASDHRSFTQQKAEGMCLQLFAAVDAGKWPKTDYSTPWLAK
jgi:hypothetical protein